MNMPGIFTVMGPVMIGPSSSHTAGAGRIGRAAYMLADGQVQSVRFLLHGSFAQTYRGHGTDLALMAGVLGMDLCDPRIKHSLSIADERGIRYSFEPCELEDVHPNTVVVEMETPSSKKTLQASSVGGGSILITGINGFKAHVTGEYPTVIVSHRDQVGLISSITGALAAAGINIVALQSARKQKGETAVTVIETDSAPGGAVLQRIRNLDKVLSAVFLDRIAE